MSNRYVRRSKTDAAYAAAICAAVVEALIGPGVKDVGLREEFVGERRDPFPRGLVPLAAPPQRAIPEAFDRGVEHQQSAKVGRHCVVGEEAGDDLAEANFPVRGSADASAGATPP